MAEGGLLDSYLDAEVRKRGEQTGLDTLVVHAVNDDRLAVRAHGDLGGAANALSLSAWGVRPQG